MNRAPSGEEEAWEAAEQAAAALGPEADVLASADPTDFGKSILTVLARAAARPTEVTGAWLAFANAMAQLGLAGVSGLS